MLCIVISSGFFLLFCFVLFFVARLELLCVAIIQNSYAIEHCIKNENVYYLSLMSQYIEKDDTRRVDFDELLISVFSQNESTKLLHCFLTLCKKCDVKFEKETVSDALSKCQNKEECVSMLNEY